MTITIYFTDGTSSAFSGCTGYASTADRVSFSYTSPSGGTIEVVANWANIKYLKKE